MAKPQINLYYTDWVSNNDNNPLQYNCLRVPLSLYEIIFDHQIISYCMNELSPKFHIETNDLFPNFTFIELFKLNITSQQLYLWSAPMDIIENYQFYLNQLPTSNEHNMSTEVFYNCTLPRFGPMCQYQFDYHYSNHASLNEIIRNFYLLNTNDGYISFDLTCYVHLQCNRRYFPSCLDWTEICDGKVDCLDNGFDEEHCWQLEINEYFIGIEPNDPCSLGSFAFGCEDDKCPGALLTSSCIGYRQKFLFRSMFSVQDNLTSDDCRSAFKCLIPISTALGSICNSFCQNDICVEIIERTCPPMLYIPAVPVLFGEIYLAFEKNDSKIINTGGFQQPYLCYNNSRYDGYFVNSSKVLFNNATCYRSSILGISINPRSFLDEKYFNNLYWQLVGYNQVLNYNPRIWIDKGIQSFDGLNVFDPTKNISFQTICDGYTELDPLVIDGRNETDETECEVWPCNNTYTRCDLLWNCLNGADEVDCYVWPTLNCPSHHHICVSPSTKQLMCLSVHRANDGQIDCLGATDEPALCRKKELYNPFYCTIQNSGSCISSKDLCNKQIDCDHGDDENFCGNIDFVFSGSICQWIQYFSEVVQILCLSMQWTVKRSIIHFSLDAERKPAENLVKNVENKVSPTSYNIPYQSRCHRGLDLRIWLNNINNASTNTCLCPHSLYGDQCQYQNQRVSLAIKFQVLSGSWETLFAIVILLIDDSNERIIHSSEQFSYLSVRDCKNKAFNTYLLYSTRRKNSTKKYSIHIDIYEKVSLVYRGSLLFPINYPFLPVHRLTLRVYIPRSDNDDPSCSNRRCIHGKCIKYLNNQHGASFCQCKEGWSGQYCTIPHSCMCSPDSLCIGVSANNRSICVCPIYKFGPRCLLIDTVCRTNNTSTCQNNGQCIPMDEYAISKQRFTCMCTKNYTGDRCEKENTKIILSFGKNIVLPQVIYVHFIEVVITRMPLILTTYKIIPIKQGSVIIRWPEPFHIVIIELFKKSYYLTFVNKTYIESTTIIKTINPSDRCPHIDELFNKTFVQLHLIRRIKYYHLPCQNSSLNLSCFHDDIHLCLCYDYGQNRLANCFEFKPNMTFDCFGQSECKNGGECLQSSPDCPQSSGCLCPPCYYGKRCQFNTNGFGLSLDAILGYHILPNVNILHQPIIVQVSMALTIIFIVAGFINGIFALITFKDKTLREVGCGLYLFGSSITTLLTMVMFGLKFWMLILAQMSVISNRSFLNIQCISVDFFLRACLNMDQWLNACVASERAITAIKHTRFDKKKSKKAAKLVIVILLVFIIGTSIVDPIYRRLIVEENEDDDDDVKRIWCIITYPPSLQVFSYIIQIFHFFAPFIINLISAIILITARSRQQSNLYPHQNRRALLKIQFHRHKNLFTAPLVLVILGLPRLIITFVSKCMKSVNDSWLFLVGYFISFIPSMLTFVIFILPSKLYKKQFQKAVVQYRTNIKRYLHISS